MSEKGQHLLLEVGTEELPPVGLKGLAEALESSFTKRLREEGLSFGGVETFATPRRLGLLIAEVASRQPDREVYRRGPGVAASFGVDGLPTRAALGFARSCGVAVSDLLREPSDKGECLVHRRWVAGQDTQSLVAAMFESALGDLPIGKRMRWGEGDDEFVRPVHWLCILFGKMPVHGRVLGVEAKPATRGHRFHHPEEISLGEATEYATRLRGEGMVEPCFERRRQMILEQVERLCRAEGIEAQINPRLLDEVTGLVEWPVALLGRFDEGFLTVPAEVLVETMQQNQRYFPVRWPDGRLDNRFIAVANIRSVEPEQVRRGNERVIRPRFADAKFFWDQDLKGTLETLLPKLETVVFQDRLGSLADKGRRVAGLVEALAGLTGQSPALAQRAGLLAKCDLVSKMVYEFPSLQGTIGGYYADRGGEGQEVSEAISEQYYPRFSGDSLPRSPLGRLLALADRLDNLVGIFGVGERPTGAKDPYGLRRASIAALRLLIEPPLELDLDAIVRLAASGFPKGTLSNGTAESVLEYIRERLTGYYLELGIPEDRVRAVLAVGDGVPSRMDRRIRAVHEFCALSDSASLASANKRIRNLLNKTREGVPAAADPTLFEDPSEHVLWSHLCALETELTPLLEEQAFSEALHDLAGMREPIDRFFQGVLVMAEDPRLRLNRLALLARVHSLFLKVADLSYLQ